MEISLMSGVHGNADRQAGLGPTAASIAEKQGEFYILNFWKSMYLARPGDFGLVIDHAAGAEVGAAAKPATGINDTTPSALNLVGGATCGICPDGSRQHSPWLHPKDMTAESNAVLESALGRFIASLAVGIQQESVAPLFS
jgi:hypothetical protein